MNGTGAEGGATITGLCGAVVGVGRADTSSGTEITEGEAGTATRASGDSGFVEVARTSGARVSLEGAGCFGDATITTPPVTVTAIATTLRTFDAVDTVIAHALAVPLVATETPATCASSARFTRALSAGWNDSSSLP